MKQPLFTGCATALVTPFLPDGSLDRDALRRLIRRQLDCRIDALVLLGTTGEPCSINMSERAEIIQIGLEETNGQCPVIVGTGSNDTQQAIAYAKQAQSFGVMGQLCVTPYYNKTSQAGLITHFRSIADSSTLPIILYNVPSRTGLGITPNTAATLAKHPQIVGFKEASGSVDLANQIIEETQNLLPVYCGNDELTLPMMACGAKGAISVCSNIAPEQMRSVIHNCLHEHYARARKELFLLLPLIRRLFTEVNPIPVKSALSCMGLIHEAFRLPLTSLPESEKNELAEQLRHLGILQ